MNFAKMQTPLRRKNKCRRQPNGAGLGVSIEAAEEKKRALLCRRKLPKWQVLIKKKGKFWCYAALLHDRSQIKLDQVVQWVFL